MTKLAWYFGDTYVYDIARRNNGSYTSISVRSPGRQNHWAISSRHQIDLVRDQRGNFSGRGLLTSANRNDIFEEVRREVAPNSPSRESCFFAFVTQKDAQSAQKEWGMWANMRPEKIEIPDDARVFEGDATFYTLANTKSYTAREAAYRYWLNRRTSNPIMEYLVDGTVFFPNWASFQAV